MIHDDALQKSFWLFPIRDDDPWPAASSTRSMRRRRLEGSTSWLSKGLRASILVSPRIVVFTISTNRKRVLGYIFTQNRRFFKDGALGPMSVFAAFSILFLRHGTNERRPG